MRVRVALLAGLLAPCVVLAQAGPEAFVAPPASVPQLIHPHERHIANLRQLTFGGENAEAYWSPDGRHLIYQSTREGVPCDQQFVVEVETGRTWRASTGKGRTTCGYITHGGKRVVYASTHLGAEACPPKPDMSRGYVWPMYKEYELFSAALDGSDVKRLTDSPGYDAEATLSPDGKTLVFTSVRDGDLDIYTMPVDGGPATRLTSEPGYDGGPFFSPDGKHIVWRRDAARSEASLERYKAMLADGFYAPGALEVWVMDADGKNKRQVTSLGVASFAPYFHPDGKRILFSTNHPEPRGRNFDVWMVNLDGTGLTRVLGDPAFDGFPMFSPDGKRLVFASNRGGKSPGETNVFVADWVETP